MAKNFTLQNLNMNQANFVNDNSYINNCNINTSPQSTPNVANPPSTSQLSTSQVLVEIPVIDVVKFKIKGKVISVNISSLKKNATQFWEKYVSPGLKGDSPVSLEDIEPEVFHHLAHYIEFGALDKVTTGDSNILKALLLAADKYSLDKLKNDCEQNLMLTLTTGTAVDLWILAADSRASTLKSEALAFFVNNAEIEKTEKFKDKIHEIINDEKRKYLAVEWYRAKTPKD